ncbi:MAG: GTP cyclohydrolase II (EC [uncultured Campylobacterales bacterium]|uniref:GTP cyclohydrolase-2 n=1 Tax=uncultured Campylobacterales bacterium TaxID=352960 RepID=A0A6S6SBA4_9BACT|nr:MAG: GTP cyclohydrolase II (EC [uncultured Campylobacterales bacterium]
MNIKISNKANLPTKFGVFKIISFKENEKEHLALYKEPNTSVPVVRIHSECLTGDALSSLKCDCGDQLDYAMSIIAKSGGYILYLRQEGRGIGLFNKVNAYSLQDKGMDTIEANLKLGFKADLRSYEVAEFMLDYFNIKEIKLLTNNPKKINFSKKIIVKERLPIQIDSNKYNEDYLNVKKNEMDHQLL